MCLLFYCFTTDMPRAEWAVDSVMVGVNETSDYGFEDTFDGE